MPEFTHHEANVLDAVRRLSKTFDPIPVFLIRDRALGAGTRYDSANTALTRLVSRGLLEKPKRGYYRVATALRQNHESEEASR